MEEFQKPEIIASIKEVNIDDKGNEIPDNSNTKAFARYYSKKTNRQNIKKHYVLMYNNNLYDPIGADSHRQSQLNLQLKEVSQETFDYYCKYLKTKNKLHLTRSQRSFING
jgi:hypothetical protein